MALDDTFLTRYIRREATDPNTGPYITGQNLEDTVVSMVSEINSELTTLEGADTTITTSLTNLAKYVLGTGTTLPVSSPESGDVHETRIDALEVSVAGIPDTYQSLTAFKAIVAASTDFANFQTRIAAATLGS